MRQCEKEDRNRREEDQELEGIKEHVVYFNVWISTSAQRDRLRDGGSDRGEAIRRLRKVIQQVERVYRTGDCRATQERGQVRLFTPMLAPTPMPPEVQSRDHAIHPDRRVSPIRRHE